MSEESVYLSIKKVALRFEVTTDCIQKWVRAGKFPLPTRLNGAVRWHIEAIEKWESEQ